MKASLYALYDATPEKCPCCSSYGCEAWTAVTEVRDRRVRREAVKKYKARKKSNKKLKEV